MDSLRMVIVSLGLYMLVMSSNAQVFPQVCDVSVNNCVNGLCQIQANQQPACICSPGYISDPADPLVCHPIPPCDLLPVPPEQQCVNGWCQLQMTGEFGCTCNTGYQLSANNPNICENTNECLLHNTGCAPNACTDMPGDYACSLCVNGYTLNQYGKCEYDQGGYQHDGGINPWLWYALAYDNFLF